jgi:hypothetical protein
MFRKHSTSKIRRPWPVTAVGLLLLAQGAGLLLLGVYFLLFTSLSFDIHLETLFSEFPHALRGTFFTALGLLALLAASGFFRLRPTAWLTGMLTEGLTLLLALGVYLRGKAPYGYLLMAYAIGLVLYLNHADVLAAFRAPVETPAVGRGENQ